MFNMNKVIFGSTKDSDMHYAVKTPITSSFFYIETKGKKYALLDKVDFGIISKKLRIKSVLLKPLADEAKKIRFKTGKLRIILSRSLPRSCYTSLSCVVYVRIANDHSAE